MRLELSDGEMLELSDHEARTLHETLLERARHVGRSVLQASSVWLSPGLAELEHGSPLTNWRLEPCTQSARTNDRAEPGKDGRFRRSTFVVRG
jgi:hypothetical protein